MRRALVEAEGRMVTELQLSGYLGKSIGQICQNGYVRDAETHGAHFVAHVLGYTFGTTCQMMGLAHGPAANVRVHEIFTRCARVGVWSLRPSTLSTCLVFITHASNVTLGSKTMANVRRSHVGIFAGGFVWHYSNRQRKVLKQTPAQFAQHDATPDNAMFYGSLI